MSRSAGQAVDAQRVFSFDPIAAKNEARRAEIASAIASGECVVAESHGEVIGYGILDHRFFGCGFIRLIHVSAGQRRRGVGSAMLTALAERCLTMKLFTSTNRSNTAMQRLLCVAGYTRCGVVHGLDDGDPELFFLLRLPPPRVDRA